MKRTLNQKQLENMIAECVGQVLAESRQANRPAQKKSNRKVMNEAQMQNYIRRIINEEMEDEGLWDYMKGAGKFFGGAAKQAGANAANAVGNAASNAYNGAKNAVGNAANGVKNFAQQGMQAGANASAAADTQKLVQSIGGLYQKYGRNLTKSQQASIRSAKSALSQLANAFQNGDMNA